jgi:hypothetical protein
LTGRAADRRRLSISTKGSRWSWQPACKLVRIQSISTPWYGSTVDTVLVAPDDTTIGPETTDPDVYHAKGLTYELYRITDPQAGEWTVRLFGADLPPEGEEATSYLFEIAAPPSGPVGGIAELPDVSTAPLDRSGSSIGDLVFVGALAGGVTVAAFVVAAGAWYARRRWLS